ncbi:hypothetical protein [Sulfitobacter sp. R18_1]|uniref:hypothetical protein n=1 Tax=Sulfitobacter sp. R18_1 TaxID=2821104 RepID=UPI001ADA6728|nr:hypothetical protein [Sulfitobacter sp. R18_1]MBO9430581.1 hypothetical protein [Sulfitobacter sp. R18_1]
MMRQPSTFSELYRWHNAAMAGKNPPVHDGEPQCGYFKRRMIKGGPWVPVRIFVEREIDPETGELASDEVLCIEVEGIRKDDPADQWTYLKPISRAEFNHLTDYRLRDTRMMDPYRPIDLSEQPTPPQGVF